MKKFSLVSLLIFMFVIYAPQNGYTYTKNSSSIDAVPSPRPPYSLLVLEWMRSNFYLTNAQSTTAPHEITIHGLWAAVKTCNGVPFNSTMMENWLKVNKNFERMQSKWPSEKAGPLSTKDKSQANMRFWTHEWDSHGKCSGMIQNAYFGMTLLIYEELIVKIYKGMDPSLSSATPGNIQKELPKKVRFTCTGQKGDNLYQIIVNVTQIDENLGKFVFGDNNRPGNCTGTQAILP